MMITRLLAIGALSLGLLACQAEEPKPTNVPEPEAMAQGAIPAAATDARSVAEEPAMPLPEATTVPEPIVNASTPAIEPKTKPKPVEAAPIPVAAKQVSKPAPKPAPKPEPQVEAAPAVEPAPAASGGADVAEGGKIAKKCLACHSTGSNVKMGPGLAGIFGRTAGKAPGMSYSDSLKSGGWAWDEAHLSAWVCDSAKAVKEFAGDASARTKMPAQRICGSAQQADLIAYLKTL